MEQIKEKQLTAYIDALSLAVVDTREFLDTHPEDKDALEFFDRSKMIAEQAKKEYILRFGPLECEDVDISKGWTWATQPMPWVKGE